MHEKLASNKQTMTLGLSNEAFDVNLKSVKTPKWLLHECKIKLFTSDTEIPEPMSTAEKKYS